MSNADIDSKRIKEQQIVEEMIRIYCKGNRHANRDNDNLCSNCAELLCYCQKRSEHCPMMENKTFCSNCPVHCYSPDMREKIKVMMRYSGPRMFFRHPCLVISHAYHSRKERKALR